MYGVDLALCVGDDVVGVGGIGEERSCEQPELFLSWVEWVPSSLDDGGDHRCRAVLYGRWNGC